MQGALKSEKGIMSKTGVIFGGRVNETGDMIIGEVVVDETVDEILDETGDIKVNETVNEMLNERGKMRWNS